MIRVSTYFLSLKGQISSSLTDAWKFSDAIRDAAGIIAYGVQSLYNGNRTGGVVGKFPFPPYYWWQSGATWGAMVNYWHFTGDNSYVNVTHEALVSQIGPTNNFILPQEMRSTVRRQFNVLIVNITEAP